MKKINKESRIPLYFQLIDVIANQIETKQVKENERILSERELCDKFDVSRATVRQAIQILEKEGYVYKEHGKGTFVSPPKMKQDLLRFYSFTEEMKKIGKVPTTKVINFEVMGCNEKIAKKMNKKKGEMVYRFTRLRLADDESMMLETSYIPVDRFPGLKKSDIGRESMYDIFTKRYNARFTRAEESFQSTLIRGNEADFLNVDTGSSGMMIGRITFEREVIIEYTIGIARGDRFEYRVVLK